ncbi:MAG: ribosome maturation factor RimM [Hyphomicrobiales bacterium]
MRNEADTVEGMILIAEIGGASGIKGEVRIKLYSDDPAALTNYGPLMDAAGKSYQVLRSRVSKSVFVCALEGVSDRNAAEALNRTKLYVSRDKLPAPDDDEFYHVDLIGLKAIQDNGETLGVITSVHDFGAGDILEITPDDGDTIMVPFSLAAVPEVNVAEGFLTLGDISALLQNEPEPDPSEGS